MLLAFQFIEFPAVDFIRLGIVGRQSDGLPTAGLLAVKCPDPGVKCLQDFRSNWGMRLLGALTAIHQVIAAGGVDEL